jgi:hypothetical protein
MIENKEDGAELPIRNRQVVGSTPTFGSIDLLAARLFFLLRLQFE